MDEVRAPEIDDSIETVFVGHFDPLEVPIILEALAEQGIFAMTKSSLDEEGSTAYPMLNDGRGSLLVDRARQDDARRIIATEVPERIEELRAGLAAETDTTEAPDDFVPFGWFEPEVARELLRQLADATIGAVPEYPLDRPPPPYARTDGRVRVHVEELFLQEAEEMLENEVREALIARAVAFTEPLLGSDES
ncbi:MAG: hypothetical protein WEB06_05685 [Actinomycetota bacterium]